MKIFIEQILKVLSGMILRKYHPKVIGITGSVGKTSTKEAVYTVLTSKFKARKNIKNYNNEIGLPLSIIGVESPGRNLFGWAGVFLKALKLVFSKQESYPEILILEMGVDRPGDMKYLTNFVKCDIGIVSAIGDIPVHIEFFGSAENVAKEKSVLVESLSKDGIALLNYDDKAVAGMKKNTQAKVITFGLKKGADVQGIEISFSDGQWTLENGALGTSFKVSCQGKIVPFRLFNVLGYQQVYAVLAATAVGAQLGMNLVEIAEAVKNYQAPPGRMKVIKGIKNTLILDDTYNAAPLSVKTALKILKELQAKGGRKIAVLGDMRELGDFSEAAHREVGELAAGSVSVLFAVGKQARFIAEQAIQKGMDKSSVLVYNDVSEAGIKLEDVMQENDLVLIKGSQGMRMEKIVEEVMAEPQRAKELLVRQDESWKKA